MSVTAEAENTLILVNRTARYRHSQEAKPAMKTTTRKFPELSVTAEAENTLILVNRTARYRHTVDNQQQYCHEKYKIHAMSVTAEAENTLILISHSSLSSSIHKAEKMRLEQIRCKH